MKIITIGSGNAVRMPKMLFAPNADGSYTKEEVEKLIQEKADASYKAGLEKAKLEKESNELETLRKEKAEREQKDLFDTIKSNLGTDEVKATGVKSFGMFTEKYHDRLNGKSGNALAQEVNKIKAELTKNKNEEQLEAFFGVTEVNADEAIKRALLLGGKKDEGKTNLSNEFYPGTTIRKK